MADFARLPNLDAETERLRLEFFQTDLDLCFTFADVAATEVEIGDLEAARRALGKAETGYAAMSRLSQNVEDVLQKQQIAERLMALRARIDSEQQRIDGYHT